MHCKDRCPNSSITKGESSKTKASASEIKSHIAIRLPFDLRLGLVDFDGSGGGNGTSGKIPAEFETNRIS